ncbi:alpha/beta hydrolase [Ponticaulis sp.]|uniref:alpha/beta hydrolase n=1 Tax=Ponticaulis sp. TaxID=2020902 RepID=UPI000B700159|nr:alpha/beta hydrolase [Ponticaulis sp.]MAI90519.1 esterase [Ponticaulis sp.]OUY00213.1 MAG: esterase [Hyphomonadaceae bacterium TMED5]|tara:strand:- start:147499 stop:148527 length:1029 start_codon:yes stop_codon:yes gene_type:complete
MSLKAFIAKSLLKLPSDWLIKMSGGRPVEIGGRRLDPHFQFIAHGARKQPPISTLPAATARAASAEGLAMLAGGLPEGVSSEDTHFTTEGRDIPIRIYRPFGQNPNMPVIVFYHFGGGVIGDLNTSHEFCGLLSHICKAPVVSVDYRLAPEHKWPAGLNDAIAAYEWALQEAETLGAPPGQAAIAGDSMGGNFSAIIAQEMQKDHKPLPVLQVLIYPATDVASDTPSMHLYAETYPLSKDTMDWFMAQYLPDGQDTEDSRISPLSETNLEGLPPAIIVTAGFDPLVDQGRIYAERLTDAGVDVEYRCYDSLAHGFTAFMSVSPAARKACEEIAVLVRDHLRV